MTARLYGLTSLQVTSVNFKLYRILLRELWNQKNLITYITPLLNELHWIPVKLHLLYCDAVLTFKCLNGTTPESLSQQLWGELTSAGVARGTQILWISRFSIPSATGQRTFHYRAVSLWNELPENIKCSSSISIFKHKLRKYLSENHT